MATDFDEEVLDLKGFRNIVGGLTDRCGLRERVLLCVFSVDEPKRKSEGEDTFKNSYVRRPTGFLLMVADAS